MQLAMHNLGEVILENNITKKDLVYLNNYIFRKPYPTSTSTRNVLYELYYNK